MGWGQWRVPELRDAQLFALRALELELRNKIRHNPEGVIRFCVGLSKQCQMQDSIIRKASRRIAELEVAQAIAEPTAPRRPRLRTWLRQGVEIVRALVLGQ